MLILTGMIQIAVQLRSRMIHLQDPRLVVTLYHLTDIQQSISDFQFGGAKNRVSWIHL